MIEIEEMRTGKVFEAIASVMADVGAVGKDATNKYDNYKYRSIDAVMNAMHPAMAKHRLFVVPEVIEQTREDRTSRKGEPMVYSVTKVKYTFFADDGSNISAVVIGEGMDRADKSMNKAMSAAFKYALFQVFCIPTEEMVDSETDSPEPTKAAAKAEAKEEKKAPAKAAKPTGEERMRNAYPSEEEMIGYINKNFPLENLTKAKDYYKVTKLEDLKFEQLIQVYRTAVKKAKEKAE